MFWPNAMPGEALYVHRLAVRRAHAGTGLARCLLDWSADEARRHGCRFLRLDTELRPRLLALYEAAAFFRYDREPVVVGGHCVVRFQRTVGS